MAEGLPMRFSGENLLAIEDYEKWLSLVSDPSLRALIQSELAKLKALQ